MARSNRRKPGGSRRGTTRRTTPGRGARRRPDVPAVSQVGRRPSSPAMLGLMGVLWVGAGIIAIISLHASWRLVPGIVFIGIGVLFLRGAAATVVRREERDRDG
ncbi:MAG TPA: hypothetical protein VKI20_03675 [Acidimicrobiales bacterium]|nr:hypothetical protein [Acidimicrobiales bacterium]